MPLARHLDVETTIASRAELDEHGRYTGEIAFYAYGPFKAAGILELAEREGIDLAESFAYSDSHSDAPMLEMVGHPVAVNPDRLLSHLARTRGWEIRRFSRPVRLRDRLRDHFPERPPAIAISASAITFALAVAGFVWSFCTRRSRARNPAES